MVDTVPKISPRGYGSRLKAGTTWGECLVHSSLLLWGCESAFSRHVAPEVCETFCPLHKQRAQGKPGADCTRGSRAEKHGSRTTGSTGNNPELRRAVRARGHFPSDDAATKLLYLILNRSEKEWRMPPREWSMAKAQFAVIFGERFIKAMAA